VNRDSERIPRGLLRGGFNPRFGSGSSIDLVDDLRELAIFGFQRIQKLIEGHGEPVGISANHLSGYPNGVVKPKQWKFEYDGLPFGNLPRCPDVQATRTNVLDYIPMRSLFDGVLGDDIGGSA
jgi:hypothetical protein